MKYQKAFKMLWMPFILWKKAHYDKMYASFFGGWTGNLQKCSFTNNMRYNKMEKKKKGIIENSECKDDKRLNESFVAIFQQCYWKR